jgi:hypothetical protein
MRHAVSQRAEELSETALYRAQRIGQRAKVHVGIRIELDA